MLQSDWILNLGIVRQCTIEHSGTQNGFLLGSHGLQKSLEVSQTISSLTKFLQTKHAPQQVTCMNTFFCLQAYQFFTFKNKTIMDD